MARRKRCDDKLTQKASPTIVTPMKESQMRLALLVEDNDMSRKLMRDILEIRFEVAEAESAEGARELLERRAPDIIFLDMRLPGADGLTFIQGLKRDPATAPIPVVAVSASAMKDEIQNALDSGCVEYVTKPIVEEPYEFVDRMARLVEEGA
jgi:two-component system cell cycle response regulator DivK